MPITQPNGAIRGPFGGPGAGDVKFAADGTMWVSNGTILTHIDVATGQVLKQYTLASPIGAFDISADGRYIMATEKLAVPFPPPQFAVVYAVDTQTDFVFSNYFGISPSGPFKGPALDVAFLDSGVALV